MARPTLRGLICATLAAIGRGGIMQSRIIVGLALFGLVGCGVFGAEDSPSQGAAAPASTPPDTDGGLPPGAPPPAVGKPADTELTEVYGVFVSTTGTASGDGTRQHPLASIAAGIERVKDLKLRVYVCGGTYAESLSLVNAVSVIGSLGCDGPVWKTGGARTVLAAPTSPALRAKDIVLTTRFDGFDVTAPAGTASAPSSIALIAENATMLTVANTTLTSAKGFDGVDGTDAIQLTAGTALTGKNGLPFSSALANPLTGPQAQIGGLGGIGSCVGAPGHDGENGKQGGNGATEICTAYTHLNTGIKDWAWYPYVKGGVPLNRSDGVPGTGAAGAPGTDGASASKLGSFTPADGYVPLDGTAGGNGSPGLGGGGGNGAPSTIGQPCGMANEGNVIYDASGAGGGAGGCPGLAGNAGGGGGASVAALVFASPGLSFTTCELSAGAGGNGGKGAFPSAPTIGGDPGLPPTDTTLAKAGGAGGPGGISGNGAGGPSVALAYTGGELVVAQDTHTKASAGGAGVADRSSLVNGVSRMIPASAGGASMPTLAF
jgi:hypothetical protein